MADAAVTVVEIAAEIGAAIAAAKALEIATGADGVRGADADSAEAAPMPAACRIRNTIRRAPKATPASNRLPWKR